MLAGFEVPQQCTITGKKGEDENIELWGMPFVLVRAANVAEKDADKSKKPTEEPAKKPTEEPAEEPAVKPTDKPKEEEQSDGGAGLFAFLLTSIAGAVAAIAFFFFYRRHQRIQAHEREVFARG
eukprot:Skav222833  [mRNA]  locus=scaffold1338:67995:68880:+ [translate_table: standard]